MFSQTMYSDSVNLIEVINNKTMYANLILAIEEAFVKFYKAGNYGIEAFFVSKVEVNGLDYWHVSINNDKGNGISFNEKTFTKLDFLCINALFSQFIKDVELNKKNLIHLYYDVAKMVKSKWKEKDTIPFVSSVAFYGKEVSLKNRGSLYPYSDVA